MLSVYVASYLVSGDNGCVDIYFAQMLAAQMLAADLPTIV